MISWCSENRFLPVQSLSFCFCLAVKATVYCEHDMQELEWASVPRRDRETVLCTMPGSQVFLHWEHRGMNTSQHSPQGQVKAEFPKPLTAL